MTEQEKRLLSLKAQAERERRRRYADRRAEVDADWRAWLTTLYGRYVAGGQFAAHHVAFWEWVWALEQGVAPPSFIAIWPRGGAKSTSAELACAVIAAKQSRKYGLYVCGSQERADDHVTNVTGMLESDELARYYPQLGMRLVGKYGSSRGWRRNRIRTQSGFTLDSIGLDTVARGVKLDEARPDLLIFDDLDELEDTPTATEKKIRTLTQSLLPAGSADLAVVGVQNLIHADSIFAQLADGRADFLADRIVSGPFPALLDMEMTRDPETGRTTITAGTPVWEGQGLAEVQVLLDRIGLRALLIETQQEVKKDPTDALWKRSWIAEHRIAPGDVPPLVRLVVGLDPSGSKRGDEVGIIVAGMDHRGHGYVLDDLSVFASPHEWARRAVVGWADHKADAIVAEVNFGGEMVSDLIRATAQTMDLRPPVRMVHTSRGKVVRAEPVAALYQEGKVHHVGALPGLEDELCGWRPMDAYSPGRLDSAVWALTELMLGAGDIAPMDDDLSHALAGFTGL